MLKREPHGNQSERISQRIEELQAQHEDLSNRRKNRCISCLMGTTLGISALAILYLAVMTAVAYAIP